MGTSISTPTSIGTVGSGRSRVTVTVRIVAGFIALAGLARGALATDYAPQQQCGPVAESAHMRTSYSQVSQTGTVSIDACAGATGCCCTDNNAPCDPVDGSGQDCDGTGCSDCCHDISEGNGHQSCCTVDGGGNVCCNAGAPACVKKIQKATITEGAKCGVAGTVVATICDDADALNLCPAAGARLVDTLTVGSAPTDDLTANDLWKMGTGFYELTIEFTTGETVTGKIEDPKNPNPFPVPALGDWGLAGLMGLIVTLGVFSIRMYRTRQA